jgi:sigma-E factor negative regulatory protein RseC
LATEEGIVIGIDALTALVKTKKSESCEGCASRKSCNVMGGDNDMEVEAINDAQARVGDRVILNFETASLLKATFFLYVFPIIFMFAGALAGQRMAGAWNIDESVLSVVFGFIFFFVSIVIVKIKGNKMAGQDRYRPRIIRIKKRLQPPAA